MLEAFPGSPGRVILQKGDQSFMSCFCFHTDHILVALPWNKDHKGPHTQQEGAQRFAVTWDWRLWAPGEGDP